MTGILLLQGLDSDTAESAEAAPGTSSYSFHCVGYLTAAQ
jgi:hypothetical protein